MSSSASSGSVLATIADMSAAFLEQPGVAVEVQMPAFRPFDTAHDRFPTRTMPVDVPVLELGASAAIASAAS
jgi:hypothetical protein